MKDPLELLWPRPLDLAVTPGAFTFGDRPVVSVPRDEVAQAAAERLVRELESIGVRARNASSPDGAPADVRLALHGAPAVPPSRESYRLDVSTQGVRVAAPRAAGLRHGISTLVQWIRIHCTDGRRDLPCLRVRDRPDFEHRGFVLDVSRNKVPTMATLRELVDLLADLKINQLQLYMEHTFAYRGHRRVWQDASPFTAAQIRTLDGWCRERAIELVPNQNSFGHLHRWLVHEPYRRLAEVPEGFVHIFSLEPEPFSVCPTDPGSLDLLRDLYDQLLPNFESRLFNVGLDETFDLGQGRSAEACERDGKERVYLRFLWEVHRLVSERGRRMLFWGDVILKRPELIDELPKDAVALEWGYEADHPFAEDGRRFAASGLEFWVCPGTSSWNSFAGRVRNMLLNLANAADSGRAHGSKGYLICDWGDHGHLQQLPITYPGLVAGSGFAWNVDSAQAPSEIPLERLLDVHVFRDRARVLGSVATGLGNAYLETGADAFNGSPLFFLLMFASKPAAERRCEGMTLSHLERTLEIVEQESLRLAGARPDRPDADLLHGELAWTADVLRLACRLGQAWLRAGLDRPLGSLPVASRADLTSRLDEISERLPDLWLARNRPGGLPESLARLDGLRKLFG